MRRCESVVQQKRIQADGALSALQKEYTELEYHLRQIKSQPEPVPPPTGIGPSRPPATDAARSPRAPLYEIIDFSPETSQETRDLLEAQLLDSGLLTPWWYQKNICLRKWKTCWRSIRIAFWFRAQPSLTPLPV